MVLSLKILQLQRDLNLFRFRTLTGIKCIIIIIIISSSSSSNSSTCCHLYRGVYNHIPEANQVPRAFNVAAILCLQIWCI